MNKIRNIILLIFTLIAFAGCEKWIDPDINIDPDKPADVTMGTILPALEANTAFRVAGGNEILRTQAMWMQQLDGIARQSMAETNYTLKPSSIFWFWDDCYAEMLMDAKMLKEKSNNEGSPHNHGLANIISAFILGQMTDVWNDIPWLEALQGQNNLHPKFDSQESIYEEIQSLLSEAIVDLQNQDDPVGLIGDYIYDGDTEKWIKAAHALKARYAIHLTKRNGNQAYLDALDELAISFSDNSEDMQFNYGTALSESNPLYQFVTQRGDVRMGAFLINLLKSYDDPRITVFALPDGTGEYTGSEPGSGNDQASIPGDAVAAPDAPSYFITYVELLFIKAEALFKTGQNANDVKETLLLAVSASLDKTGVMDEIWFSGYTGLVNSLSGDELFKEIMTQKYIATFYQPEAYHSWRRTGIPELTPNPNGATAQIPRRFPYPATEQLYNQHTPTGIKITDPVWWDE